LLDQGLVDEDEPIELIDGLLLVKEPQRSPHRTAIILVAKALERAFGDGWFVQTQSPIILDDRSEPEPDVCVVRGFPRDYAAEHPRSPALVVEVANLFDRVLELHREPMRPGPARRHWGYATIETLGADATITPLAAPAAGIPAADLLP
jgi:Uma2 family endonuclease